MVKPSKQPISYLHLSRTMVSKKHHTALQLPSALMHSPRAENNVVKSRGWGGWSGAKRDICNSVNNKKLWSSISNGHSTYVAILLCFLRSSPSHLLSWLFASWFSFSVVSFFIEKRSIENRHSSSSYHQIYPPLPRPYSLLLKSAPI